MSARSDPAHSLPVCCSPLLFDASVAAEAGSVAVPTPDLSVALLYRSSFHVATTFKIPAAVLDHHDEINSWRPRRMKDLMANRLDEIDERQYHF